MSRLARLFVLSLMMLCAWGGNATAATDTILVSGSWIAPPGVTLVDVEVWGGGGAGGGQNQNSDGGGGGGGGAYSKVIGVAVTPGNSYTVTVGAGGVGVVAGTGGAGGDSYFINAATVMAKGGAGGAPSTGTPPPGGLGGAAAAGVGTTKLSGGNGGQGLNNNTGRGGPGGSSAGTAANGTSGPTPWTTATAAAAPAGGGIGGNGGNANGQNGFAPASGNGGGGGGSAEGTNMVGGVGAGGKVMLTYTLPAVTSINLAATSPTNAASVSWTVTFSTSVTGVSSGNFTPVNSGLGGTPAITGVSGGGNTWTVTVSTGTGSGTLGLNMVNVTGISPAVTSTMPFPGQVYTIDRTAPTVASITRVNPAPTALASVSWTVTFSETVTGVDASDFALAQAYGMSGALITAVTPVSGTVYTVSASTGIGNGTLGLNLVDNNSIADAVSNPLGGAVAGDGNFSGEVYDVYITSATGSPTACSNVAGIGTIAWGTLTGPLANDNVVYSTASVDDNQITNYLQCTGYGFAIPDGATINGITVNVDRKASGTLIRDAAMRLVKDVAGVATIQATDRSTLTNYTTVDVSEAHGGATDLWLGTWAPADINSANFGAALASTKAGATGGARIVSVDHISITVDYSLPVNCTSVTSGNWNAPATWVMCRGGIPLAGDTVTIATGHTVTQNINTPAIGTLSINGTLNNAANTLTVDGDVLINAGGIYSGGSGAASTTGNFSNSGAFTSGSGTWNFNGAAAQSITGATNFQNLALNNASGLTLNDAVTASSVLTLTSGAITTGTNILSASANCPASVARTGGFVNGYLRLTFPTGTTACTYPIGSGTAYAPIGITMVALAGGTLTGSTTGNEHPQVASSGIDATKDVNRYWSLWESGDTVAASSYSPTFNFIAGDVDSGATATIFVLGKYQSGAWTLPVPVASTGTSTGATGIAGPLDSTVGFAVGEAKFVCNVPSGLPPGMTCECDNFNRTSVNPSTIFGGNFTLTQSSGTPGWPQIANLGFLQMTNNSTDMSTSATVPGTFPAAGNIVSFEFRHYAYRTGGGAGADGIAVTLSDSSIVPLAGAFGGSLGYAQKTIAGGAPVNVSGFAGGWIGIGIDEWGNYSAATEGRVGGIAQTAQSVAVRGSGVGLTGYPYLAGTAALSPILDNTGSATPARGDAYRVQVDARCYQNNFGDCAAINPTAAKYAEVSVYRDTTGAGTFNVGNRIVNFEAYATATSKGATQADVPATWKLSYTGSTGGSTNFHELGALKICGQTFVPPAGYRIQVDNLTPSTCGTPGGSPSSPIVTVTALDTNGNPVSTYDKTVTLSAPLSGGGASSAVWSLKTGAGTFTAPGQYTFVPADNGVAQFYLTDASPQSVTITVSENGGTISSSLAPPPIVYSGGAFTIANIDALAGDTGGGVVAGRPHLMSVTRSNGCATDTTYTGAKNLDGWYTPAIGDHPAGALAPQLCATNVSGTCLPATGACQTLSIAEPSVAPLSNNMPTLTFASGIANFCIATSDIGKYSVSLRDDSATPVAGSSGTLTARPFAIAVRDLNPVNPAGSGPGSSIFTSAGTNFSATVSGYLWAGTGASIFGNGDTDGNGLPDDPGATFTEISAGGLAPSYADTVTLAADTSSPAKFAPAAPPATQGYLGGGAVAVAAGSGVTTTLNYDEVGSFTLKATPATSYLSSGVDLSNRVAIFAGASNARTSVIGRFIPDHFLVAGTVVSRSDLQVAEGQAAPFTYMGEPMKLTLTITAQSAGGGGTPQNYSDATGYSRLDAAALGTGANWFNTGCLGATKCMGLGAVDGATGLTDRLAIVPSGTYGLVTNPAISWDLGIGTVSVHLSLDRSALPDGSFEALKLGAMPRDADAVTLPAASPDLDAATNGTAPFGPPDLVSERRLIANTRVRFGRLWLGNACGSEKRDLTIPFRAEYWNGNVFITNPDDSLTSIAKANIGLGNHQPVGFDGRVDLTHIPAGPFSVASGLGSFSLGKPPTGLTAAGSVDIVFALGLDTATNASFNFSTAQPPTVGANMPYLRGKWYGANYDRDPVARAAFGIFCGGSGGRQPIYIRESY